MTTKAEYLERLIERLNHHEQYVDAVDEAVHEIGVLLGSLGHDGSPKVLRQCTRCMKISTEVWGVRFLCDDCAEKADHPARGRMVRCPECSETIWVEDDVPVHVYRALALVDVALESRERMIAVGRQTGGNAPELVQGLLDKIAQLWGEVTALRARVAEDAADAHGIMEEIEKMRGQGARDTPTDEA